MTKKKKQPFYEKHPFLTLAAFPVIAPIAVGKGIVNVVKETQREHIENRVKGEFLMKQKKKNIDPTMKMPGALLWILCAPAALLVSSHYDSKESKRKRKLKRAKKEAEFRKYWGLNDEFDWWQDNQGL